jgi:FixJ family two-component response regulator
VTSEERSTKLGAVAFFQKPFDNEALFYAIRQAIGP